MFILTKITNKNNFEEINFLTTTYDNHNSLMTILIIYYTKDFFKIEVFIDGVKTDTEWSTDVTYGH
jgi:hypothetical protein